MTLWFWKFLGISFGKKPPSCDLDFHESHMMHRGIESEEYISKIDEHIIYLPDWGLFGQFRTTSSPGLARGQLMSLIVTFSQNSSETVATIACGVCWDSVPVSKDLEEDETTEDNISTGLESAMLSETLVTNGIPDEFRASGGCSMTGVTTAKIQWRHIQKWNYLFI